MSAPPPRRLRPRKPRGGIKNSLRLNGLVPLFVASGWLLPYIRPKPGRGEAPALPAFRSELMPWSNQPGGPWSSGPRGPWGSGPQQQGPRPPDLEEFLRRSQDRLRHLLPGNFGGWGVALIALVAVVLWGSSGLFRVEPDEIGVVLRFGKYVRQVPPGLHYHLPYPVESVLTPPALRVIKTDVGMRESASGDRDVPEESLMLTGDENIVDVDFSVLWKVQPDGVGDYLFNIQNPESTVKAVAESAMREVIGRSNIQPVLTGARLTIETAVQELMQKTLDSYHAGVLVQQVQLQKVNPPAQVIDAFLDVQAARSDLERLQNEAQTYANRVVPEAKGRAARVIQDAEAYRAQVVANAKGQSSRFLQVYDQYKKAPDVTRERMYLDTMERILSGTDKTFIDTGAKAPGVIPYLPLPKVGQSPSAPDTVPTTGAKP
jgi:modulator of FtsH protease HflK